MPPSMAKMSQQPSVRDRIAAFERNHVQENGVIRARYVPDVKGTDRFRPSQGVSSVEPSRALMGHLDKNSNGQLPTLIQPGKIRLIQADDGYEENGVEKVQRRTVRRINLPILNNASPRAKSQREKDIVDYIEQQARHAMALNSSGSESQSSARSSARGRLNPIQSNGGVKVVAHERRTFAQLGVRQNGVIINREANHVSEPPRSKSASNIASQIEREEDNLLRQTKDMATQTARAKASTMSVECLEEFSKGTGTQTEVVIGPHIVVDSQYSRITNKEHRAMLTAINQALDATIDRYSRVRTEQAIINTARKQTQVWRDAKDFIATQLVPQSIALANQSRSTRRTAAEIVANIKCYP